MLTRDEARTIRYSYEDAPTLYRFAASDARIRGIRGPFRCLPGETEFMTPNGWKRIDEWQRGDKVLQWSPDREASFVEPEAWIENEAEEFIRFENVHGMRMVMTPNHRIPHYNWEGKFSVKTAEEIACKPSKRTIPTTFNVVGERVEISDDMIRFAVMMHADGHYPKRGKRAQIKVRKERKKERIRQILSSLGIQWDEATYASRPTETAFTFVPPYIGKRFTGWWWSLPTEQLRVVMDEIDHWDGHRSEIRIYASAYEEDADFVQYAAHACGLRATISRTDYDQRGWHPSYRVSIRMGDNIKNRMQIREHVSITREDGGWSYCFTVPSGFFVVRHEGCVFVTGNSGKSSASVIEIITRGLAQKKFEGISRTRWIVVRNSFRQLEDSTIRTTHMWLPPGQFGQYKSSDHTYTIKAFPNVEIEILFRALDRPDHVANLLSVETTGAWFNEAREVPWALVDAMDGRIGQYPPKMHGGPTWYGMWLDTNPPDVDSAWYRFFEEKTHRAGRVEQFVQPSGLSPEAENLSNLVSRAYYADLAEGKSEDWINVYIHGKYGFVAEGKVVFPEWNDRLHCREVEPVEGVPVIRSYDWGLTPACVFSQILPDGRWITFDEITTEGMGADQFSDVVLEHCARAFPRGATFEDYGDPAGEQRSQVDARTVFEIFWGKGIKVVPSEQSPRARQEAVRYGLRTLEGGEPKFTLHPRCKQLRKGFNGGYHFRRLRVSSERYVDHPDKNKFSHPMDALQYAMVPYFGNRLRSDPDADYPWDGFGSEAGIDASRSRVTGY